MLKAFLAGVVKGADDYGRKQLEIMNDPERSAELALCEKMQELADAEIQLIESKRSSIESKSSENYKLVQAESEVESKLRELTELKSEFTKVKSALTAEIRKMKWDLAKMTIIKHKLQTELKPVQPVTSYIQFIEEMETANPEIELSEIEKLWDQKWEQMDVEKAECIDREQKANERYHIEMELYNKVLKIIS